MPEFIFVVCQSAATAAARQEILRLPGLNLAFSQPGFITFKVDPGSLPEKFHLPVTLARSYGWGLGRLTGENADEHIQAVISHAALADCQHLHVFERETLVPGDKGFEPGVSVLAAEIAQRFRDALNKSQPESTLRVNEVAKPDEMVFDVILVKPSEWWLGYHHATHREQRWIGGVPTLDINREVISRAYFKLQEALLWSGFKLKPGEVCCEIGSAPGGACQFLLEQGHPVIAVDPAEMDETINDHPQLTHLRRRGREVRKKDLKDVRWLMADLNIAPAYTLDTVDEIVANAATNVRGLLLTLKLSDWNLVNEIPAYLNRVKSLGYQVVKARQLAFNRKEFCLAAAKDRFEVRRRRGAS